ncbi:MAG: hypothetical protein WAN76_19525 [Candidatus Sulfotelmatobacter sp.]
MLTPSIKVREKFSLVSLKVSLKGDEEREHGEVSAKALHVILHVIALTSVTPLDLAYFWHTGI